MKIFGLYFSLSSPLIILLYTPLSNGYTTSMIERKLGAKSIIFETPFKFQRRCLSATKYDGDIDDGTKNYSATNTDSFLKEIQKRNLDEAGLRENYDVFGLLAPLAKIIDVRTGGWGLSYADTSPYTDKTVVGLLFLSTNFFFVWAGINLFYANNLGLSVSIEVAGLASFYYHWCQIHYGPKRDEVRLSLLIDYITAFVTINLTFLDLILLIMRIFLGADQDFSSSAEPILFGVLGIFCLFGSWIFEYGLPYIVLHGFWHIFSALSASSLEL